MRTFDRYSSTSSVLASPEGAALVDAYAPEVMLSPVIRDLGNFPFGSILALVLGTSDDRIGQLLVELSKIADPTPKPEEEPPILPNPSYESEDVARSGASVTLPSAAQTHRRAEVTLVGPSHGNPFVDVELSAEFTHAGKSVSVGGFYDGQGRYLIRFLPPASGTWEFLTTSNARSLDGIRGSFDVAPSDTAGPVHVADTFHFAHADGTPFTPIGTTSYAWTHQPDELQDQTLATLATTPFNKLRMCLFPKHFLYNSTEPELFVFPRADDASWDTTRFDTVYFANLERRLDQLDELGIQADLIIFHPYDHWGFANLGQAADDRYVKYLVRRLAAFPNVWWSMANEYDLLNSKRTEDWDRLGQLVKSEDHVGHPISIHNWIEHFDHSRDWVTHCSIQAGDYRIGGKVDEWRRQWNKPVLVDEFGYEGDLDQGWGNLLAEEEVRRFWDGMLRGGYLTHGETFYSEDEVIWWSKGGTLRGESPPRIDFLRSIVADSPSGRLDPLLSDWDFGCGGVAGKYIITYFGASRPLFRDITIPDGMTALIDVIDTWNMTVQTLPGSHSGKLRVQLPARPYTAIRLRSVE